MNLYTESDKELLNEHVEEIIKNADDISSRVTNPTIDQLWEIIFTVRDFVIEKKRKIYGGFALNKLIEMKNPNDKFYMDDDIKSWDIDFYSPTPIEDAKEIANRLHDKGFKHIQAREAMHDETYKVFAETNDCADITYVPWNIYNKIPFNEVNGLYLTGPQFMMIDYFRILTDPLTSYFRLEKAFNRLCLMLKHYPIKQSSSEIDIIPAEGELDIAMRTIQDFLTDRESTVVVGMYAFEHLIKEADVSTGNKQMARNKSQNRSFKKQSSIDYSDINYYEIISTSYQHDAKELILMLKNKFPQGEKQITYTENYPFFQYMGYSVDIKFNDIVICRMYHYNSRCTPYFDVPSMYFKKSSFEKLKGKIRIGTFAVQMLFNLINVIRARVIDDRNTMNIYYTLISQMIELRNTYMTKNKKTLLDESLFQEFVLKCVGTTTTAQMEKANRIEKKMKAGKRYSWGYNPKNEKDRANESKYLFKNSSGNPIKNERNWKINLQKDYDVSNEDIDTIDEEVEDVEK